MAKFKIGDRVRNLVDNGAVILGATGTIDENESFAPWVVWDDPNMLKTTRADNRTARLEEHLELINEKENMTTEQKINELQAQLDALRAELDKPKRPMAVEEISDEMSASFNDKYYHALMALQELIILRDAWGGGRKSDSNGHHVIRNTNGTSVFAIAFSDSVTRDEFETQFADLIKTASPLLG
jgi:hypothetical protein